MFEFWNTSSGKHREKHFSLLFVFHFVFCFLHFTFCFAFCTSSYLLFAFDYVLLFAFQYDVLLIAFRYILLLLMLHVSMFCTVGDLPQTAKYPHWMLVPALKRDKAISAFVRLAIVLLALDLMEFDAERTAPNWYSLYQLLEKIPSKSH